MTSADGRALRMAVLAVVAGGFVLPIIAGFWETLAAAFGHLPAIGAVGPTLEPWRKLETMPGIVTSLALTTWTGLAATFLSLILALALVALAHGRLGSRRLAAGLVPHLATPHAAMAIGLAFLIAPSGWIARALSPWATGWSLPPDIATVHDSAGLALILGLLLKEVPFLILVATAALGQLSVRQDLRAGRALGYGAAEVWLRVILPQLYRLIRLPVYVTLSFALSVVDMAMILGPSNPPVLAVSVTRWFFEPDSAMLPVASAGAVLQVAVVFAGIGLWRLGEALVIKIGCAWLRGGRRSGLARPVIGGAGLAALAGLAMGGAALAALAVWSVAWRWSFPFILPERWSLDAWMRPGSGWLSAVQQSVAIGLASTALSVVLAIAWLEGEDEGAMARARWAGALLYLPLVLPQIAFLYGLNVFWLRSGLKPGVGSVIWGHVLFVFPYVMITLTAPWRALDRRMLSSAAALGAGPMKRLLRVKLPVLMRPILIAASIGFAVSIALYLPTLFLGAGRTVTLTTEAVTLSSGSDRRITAVYGTLQSLLPLVTYALAVSIPAIMQRNRRGLSGGAG